MELTHHFLLSMPQMEDPNFKHTLTYIIDHGDHGALGFVINRDIGIKMKEVFDQMDIDPDSGADIECPVFEGGPVDREHGLVLHPAGEAWKSSKDFGHGICLSSSRDILVDMARCKGPDNSLVLLGHSGWGPGQLEEEMTQNAWLSCPASADILFDMDIDNKLPAAASVLGVDLSRIVSVAGHA